MPTRMFSVAVPNTSLNVRYPSRITSIAVTHRLRSGFSPESDSEDSIILVDPCAPRPATETDDVLDEDEMGHLDLLLPHEREKKSDPEKNAGLSEEGDGKESKQLSTTQSRPQVAVNDSSNGLDEMRDATNESTEHSGIETRNKKRRRTSKSVEKQDDQKLLRRMVRIEVDYPYVYTLSRTIPLSG